MAALNVTRPVPTKVLYPFAVVTEDPSYDEPVDLVEGLDALSFDNDDAAFAREFC
jgi:hypothetical protein